MQTYSRLQLDCAAGTQCTWCLTRIAFSVQWHSKRIANLFEFSVNDLKISVEQITNYYSKFVETTICHITSNDLSLGLSHPDSEISPCIEFPINSRDGRTTKITPFGVFSRNAIYHRTRPEGFVAALLE